MVGVDRGVWAGCRRLLPCLSHRPVRGTDRERRKGCVPASVYVNAALRDPFKNAPGPYESGGPPDNVLSIWKAEAPAIDVLAPDIYLLDTQSYLKVMELCRLPETPLFIPETAGTPRAARSFCCLGKADDRLFPFRARLHAH